MATSLAVQTWTADFNGEGGHWSIERQSSGTGILQSNSDIRGSITPIRVTPSGRSIKGIASKSSNLEVNNVGSKERLSATEGRIIIQEGSYFAYDDSGGYDMISTYSGGTYIAEHHELWPVILYSRNVVNYKGTEINDLSQVKNTYDRIGEELLYNKNLEKDLYVNTSLARFNVSLISSNGSLLAEIQPAKYLNYNLITKTSGIADLFTRVVDTKFDVKRHQTYPYSVQNEERYVGNYNIQKRIQENYTFITPTDEDLYPGDDWLPCSCLKDDFTYPVYYQNNTFEKQYEV